MLTTEEIRQFLAEDAASVKKQLARVGQRYYEGDHDIRGYRLFFYNGDGLLVEDKSRSNVKICHPFFRELTDQAVQYVLSGGRPFVLSDDPQLQQELDRHFNSNDEFMDELGELLTDCQVKGFAYLYAMLGADERLHFNCADALGVVEVEGRFASDRQDHVLYWYMDRIDREGHRRKKIMDWDKEKVTCYLEDEEGNLLPDSLVTPNPRPHILYQLEGDENTYCESLGTPPFFRMDNNRQQRSNLVPIKSLIDDYDLMASSLSNNLIDFDTPIHVVRGFEGDNLDELQQNLRTKKVVGVGSDGGVEIMTVDVPYQARETKLNLDEKNIYRFGMGLNLNGLKDTASTTNVAIKAAYSLLDLRCDKLERNLKRFLRRVVALVLQEVNRVQGTTYTMDMVHFHFTHELMSNEKENAEIKKLHAEQKQLEAETLLTMGQMTEGRSALRQTHEEGGTEWTYSP